MRKRNHYLEKRSIAALRSAHYSFDVGLEMAPLVLLILISQVVVASENYRKEGFINRLSNGMKFATDLLGSESVALKVAEFVVQAFQTVKRPTNPFNRQPNEPYTEETGENLSQENQPSNSVNEVQSPMAPLKYLVRLFGLEPNKISAVAVNALVFVAQMISSFLAGNKRPSKHHRTEEPTAWIMNKQSRKLQDLLARAKNESLFDDIEEIIRSQGDSEETSCIRLLVCKITPYVHKMQETVFGKNAENNEDYKKLRGSAALYRHLPTTNEINHRSEFCEKQHRDCDLNE